ncbi:IucA/IucC family protein [Paenibacillus algorifonticola]|uniref:IucA/IucC family protein n=1 Tax=Paenibacillus algorifonticola TaxID=684063 RepID=UPI003D2939A9
MSHISLSLMHSHELIQVRRRIFRQLIESLLYERIITGPAIASSAETEYELHGKTDSGEQVAYRFKASRKKSFGRIRLSEEPVVRCAAGHAIEADSLPRFLLEIAAAIGTTETLLSVFIDEIQQTLLKDTMAVQWMLELQQHKPADYDDWESYVQAGHPYHPCYKSRIGFTLEDNLAYGPEFKPELKLAWVAVHYSAASFSISRMLDLTSYMQHELGADYAAFQATIEAAGKNPSEYRLLPVHPWQWERFAAIAFFEQLESQEIIYLGYGSEGYVPQQSIRTLGNRADKSKAYVKLPLSITNTSSGRILSRHTLLNAARISDWLGEMVASDAFLRDELRLIMLKEVLGISYQHQQLPNLLEQKVYGALGAIWRESLHPYLEPSEEALPFGALSYLQADGTPVIDGWIQEHGLEGWVKKLLSVSVIPLIHLLYAHGTALESHAQNMMIVLERGLPTRIALKDFHDGIRYSPAVHNPLGYPDIMHPPANHQRVNRNSFIAKEDVKEVKDFLLDAFMFINLTELAFFLEQQYGLTEEAWWGMTAEIIAGYQEKFPELQDRFDMFDLFASDIEVEQLTKRRLYVGPNDCVHSVSNPLYAFRPKHRTLVGE